MAHQEFHALADHRLNGIALISTDVFDTLLLRRIRSERRRIIEGETLFAEHLLARGLRIGPERLVEARLQSQRLAFRTLATAGAGEVRLVDVIDGQLRMLGVPAEFAADRIAIEVAVEKRSLFANHALADALRGLRRTGRRIVAVSDTTLPAAAVAELITTFHGPGLVDKVWSSADEGRTKRAGDLFLHVAAEERMRRSEILHVGDDETADVRVPTELGIAVHPIRRDGLRRFLTKIDGGFAEVGRRRQRRQRVALVAAGNAGADAHAIGRDILGPVAAQFALQIWLYSRHAATRGRPVIAFCARGGIGIRTVFEQAMHRLGLPVEAPRANLMISRLVAARGALLAGHQAAYDELGREFGSASNADVAHALGRPDEVFPEEWQRPFQADAFRSLLTTAAARPLLDDLRHQHGLFLRHLDEVCAPGDRLILCDTGLYGSTQRLLAAALPGRSIETIQFARANYKGHSEEHFPRTAGLVVESNVYTPLEVETCVLRYWHLIESLFEPRLPSVRRFHLDDEGRVAANCGDISLGAVDAFDGNALLRGVLDYVDGLQPGDGAVVAAAAEAAWPRLHRLITHPDAADVARLAAGPRSVDFGRSGVVDVLPAAPAGGLAARVATIRRQLWREGAIAQQFPLMKPTLLTLLDAAHSLRGLASLRHR